MTRINGHVVATGLAHFKRVKKPIEALETSFILPEGYVFLLGDTVDSFDGRYYGPVPVTRLLGGASVVF